MPVEYNPLEYEDILMGDKDALFGQVGMDWKGNNEFGKQARIALQALWPVIAQRLASMNQMNPAVKRAVEQLTMALSPEGVNTLADEQSARFDRQGAQSGEYRASKAASAGASDLTQEGLRQAEMNRSTEAGNAYLNDLYSPEKIASRSAGLLDIQNNLASPLLQQGQQLGGFVEQRHQQNQMEKQQGGLGGLGSILGMVGSLAGGGGLNLSGLLQQIMGGGKSTIPGMGGVMSAIGGGIGGGMANGAGGYNFNGSSMGAGQSAPSFSYNLDGAGLF